MGGAGYLADRFVREVGCDDGIAFCVRVRLREATLVYTDVPGVVEETRVVPASQVRTVILPFGTRVWGRSTAFGWIPGEIAGHMSHGRYLVRSPGRDDRVYEQRDLRVRWNRGLISAAEAVAHGVVEGTEYYDARQPVVREIARQRALSRGFSAALSAGVLPFQHQFDVLARVVGDPVLRFVLADEVGLGKTIEAGLIIRQLLLDDPATRVAVVVPEHLKGQWSDELETRLLLQRHRSRLRIAGHGELRLATAASPDLLVIDEAHRLVAVAAQDSQVDQELKQAAATTRGLLLLTATPMRDGADNLLRMLELIDPHTYAYADLAAFQQRIAMRQEQAQSIELLQPGVPSNLVAEVLEELLRDYSDDAHLRAVASEARSSIATTGTAEAQQLEAVADHMRETYRISRRIIRHRRDAAEVRGFPVSGRRPELVPYTEPARAVIDRFLDDWHEVLRSTQTPTDERMRARFWSVVEQALAGPVPLLSSLDRILDDAEGVTATELALFRNVRAALRLGEPDARERWLANSVRAIAVSCQKVLIFTSFSDRALRLVEHLHTHFGEDAVAAHVKEKDQAELDGEVARFLYDPDCWILVADESGEEGRNFQAVDVIINADVPLSANALEQRLGRVDRFNLRAGPLGTRCVYLIEEDSQWCQAVQHYLFDAVGVTERSVATLQRVLSELELGVRDELIDKGPRALMLDVGTTRELLENEREEIDLLEELEATQHFADFADAQFDELQRYESDPTGVEFAYALLTSRIGGIGLQQRASGPPGVFSYALIRGRGGALGLPPDAVQALSDVLPGLRTFDRLVAGTNSDVAPMRFGDPLVNWLDHYLRVDECGRAVAVARAAPVKEPELWLCHEYLIEFNAETVPAPDVAERQRVRRRADAVFPPRIDRVWVDGISEADTSRLPFLDSDPDKSDVAEEPIQDDAWTEVLRWFPDWTDRCSRSAAFAYEKLLQRDELCCAVDAGLTSAEQDSDRRARILAGRAARFPDGLERDDALRALTRERDVAKQLQRGIRQFAVTTLACLAVVLVPDE